MDIGTVVGASSVVFAFACTVPQLLKLRRVRTAAGVSIAALANSTISGAAWTTYGVAHHAVWVALPSLVGIPATAAALVIAWRRGAARGRLWLPVAWAAVLATAAAVGPWVGPTPLTVALGFSIALMITPAAITAWRSRDVSALAANAWGMLIADALLAGTYGYVAHVAANVLYAAVATAGSLLILTRLAIPTYVHELLVPHRRGLPGHDGDPDVAAVDTVLHELELEWRGEFVPALTFEPIAA
jgi:uncharacterized protein with PQ loop repeat